MKRWFASILFIGITFMLRVGEAGIPQHCAMEEIAQAHHELLVPDPWVEEALGIVAHPPKGFPCEGVVTSEFGPRHWGRRWKMHEGIDIAAPTGTPVSAPSKGRVVFAGRKSGYGLTLILAHGGQITTLFGHNSQLFVSEGEWVQAGQVISEVGNTGRSTGPHLHYEVRREGEAVDPSEYI